MPQSTVTATATPSALSFSSAGAFGPYLDRRMISANDGVRRCIPAAKRVDWLVLLNGRDLG